MSTFKYFTLVNGDYKGWMPDAIQAYTQWDLRIEYDETGRPIDAQFAVGACTVPKDDGWEDWRGATIPPTPEETLVDIVLRSGRTLYRYPAGRIFWGRDVVKWRLAKKAELGDGWESWPGGDCPVRPFVEVEVETTLGQRRRGRADDFNWGADLCCPIVKWRLARG